MVARFTVKTKTYDGVPKTSVATHGHRLLTVENLGSKLAVGGNFKGY